MCTFHWDTSVFDVGVEIGNANIYCLRLFVIGEEILR